MPVKAGGWCFYTHNTLGRGCFLRSFQDQVSVALGAIQCLSKIVEVLGGLFVCPVAPATWGGLF